MKTLLLIALIAAAIPLAWLYDALRPVATTKTAEVFHGNCLAAVRLRGRAELLNHLVVMHVNDTARVDLLFHGCTPARGEYVFRVAHLSTGQVYEYADRIKGSRSALPLFTAEVGGVYWFTLYASFEAEGSCHCEALLVIKRGEKGGYVRVYAVEALAGALATAGVLLHAYRRLEKVA